MKIYDLNLTGGASAAQTGRAQQTQQADHAGHTKAPGAGAGGTGDRVEFSSTLGRLSQALAADGASRAARVSALAAQHQSGNYRPDSAATSHGMVSEALAAGH